MLSSILRGTCATFSNNPAPYHSETSCIRILTINNDGILNTITSSCISNQSWTCSILRLACRRKDSGLLIQWTMLRYLNYKCATHTIWLGHIFLWRSHFRHDKDIWPFQRLCINVCRNYIAANYSRGNY